MNFYPAQPQQAYQPKFFLIHLIKIFSLAAIISSPFSLIYHLRPLQSPAPHPTVIKPSPPAPSTSQFGLLLQQKAPSKTPQILGTQTLPPQLPRSSYTIAVLGDSMIDVMQPGLPQLKAALEEFYPQTEFNLLNYGVGASDMESALERLNSSYTYLEKTFPPLLSQTPDIIVIESFAYNHWGNTQADLDRQWLTIAKIIDSIKEHTQAKIILAAHIGPDENTLGDGIPHYHLSPEDKKIKAQIIRAYLQNIINFATSQGYPLADAYHASLDENGNGQPKYISQTDHLHPSGPGGELLAQKIAAAIWENKLLEKEK